MKKLTKAKIEKLLKKKNINPKISWLYIQFEKLFEEEFIIDEINLNDAIKNLVNFLKNKKINEIVFFPEPEFPGINGNIPSGIIKIIQLKKFLKQSFDPITNYHISDKNLNWIFTMTHENDFFISGNKKLVKEFIKFFKNARCISYKELKKIKIE